jgi:hypothetical protein
MDWITKLPALLEYDSDGFRRGRGFCGHAASSALIMPLRIKGEEEEAPMH